MFRLPHTLGLARSRLALVTTNTFGSKNTEPRQTNYSKPVSTLQLPRPTHQEVGDSTLPDIRTAKNRIKWSNPSNTLHG